MAGETKKLRVAFMGTPDFAVPALQHLIDHEEFDVVAVYSQPPRPKGRGHQVQPSPVHELAARHDIPVHTPKSLKKDAEARAQFAELELDVAIVAAYGLILPLEVLEAPKYGCLNIHASLLPRWRGAAPIQYAIWAGDAESGVTIMQMEEGLDTGPMILKRAVTIHPHTTAQSLHDELSAMGGALCIEALEKLLRDGKLEAEVQDDSLSCYAHMLKKEDGHVEWSDTANAIDRQIRALNPWPGVWATLDGKRLKIHKAELVSEHFTDPPGTIIDHIGHVACGQDTGLRLLEIQPENARRMDIAGAYNGNYIDVDKKFA